MLRCRLLGHRPRFSARGRVMRWECERGCGFSGEKLYATEADAARYASGFDREDQESLGKRSPLSLAVLRLGRRRS